MKEKKSLLKEKYRKLYIVFLQKEKTKVFYLKLNKKISKKNIILQN